jgi:hypothetical protein
LSLLRLLNNRNSLLAVNPLHNPINCDSVSELDD